ncbi:MAG: hypothetical protein AAF674_07025 [Pseudomonadota bacterium]
MNKPRLVVDNTLNIDDLPSNPRDAQLYNFLERAHKQGVSLAEKTVLIEAITLHTKVGKRDLNRIWKKVEKVAKSKQRSNNLDDGPAFYPYVNEWNFSDLVEHGWKRVLSANERNPFLFQLAGEMVRVLTDELGVARIEIINQRQFAHALNSVSKWTHVRRNGDEEFFRGVHAPNEVVDHIFNGPRDALLPLRRLVTVPTYTRAKRLTPQGYAEGIYYAPLKGLSVPVVPPKPSDNEVTDAVGLFADVLGDFPLDGLTRAEFLDKLKGGKPVPSFSHAVSYMLSSICRDLIDGPVPGHLARKDKPRSGATLLMSVAEYIATPQPCSPQTLPYNEDEVRKTLIGIFGAGSPYVLFDNLKSGVEIESDALAVGLTSYPSFKGRLLGTNVIQTMPANCVFGFTGNRSALSPQLAERMLLIDVDPKMENPSERHPSSFKHNLASYVPAHAGKLLWCLLMLVQNWIAKGCPEWTGIPLGGFERHAAVVGGILDAAGIKGFMTNREKLAALVKTDDPVNDLMDALIAEYVASKGNVIFKVGGTDIKPPAPYENCRVVSISDVLNEAQIALDKFGYTTTSEGEIFYAPAANRKIAQRFANLVGTVRETIADGEVPDGRWRLAEVPDVPRKIGNLYRLEFVEQPAKAETRPTEPRRSRRNRKF